MPDFPALFIQTFNLCYTTQLQQPIPYAPMSVVSDLAHATLARPAVWQFVGHNWCVASWRYSVPAAE